MAIVMSHSALSIHSSAPSPGTSYTTSPVIVAFTVGVLICFIAGFCCIYICRCCFMTHLYAWIFDRPDALRRDIHSPATPAATGGNAIPPILGLDMSLLQNFPVFIYSSVKEVQEKDKDNDDNKYGLECAICLFEFEDDSLIRLLTFCRHVFHQDCIDSWLECHKTCPVCRSDLEASLKGKKILDHENEIEMEENSYPDDCNENNEICIDVREEEEEDEVVYETRFTRSHSTGHSIVIITGREGRRINNYDGDDGDHKFMLKLPEHVEMNLARGQHIMASKSCSSYGEMTRNCNRCYYAEAISCSSNSITS